MARLLTAMPTGEIKETRDMDAAEKLARVLASQPVGVVGSPGARYRVTEEDVLIWAENFRRTWQANLKRGWVINAIDPASGERTVVQLGFTTGCMKCGTGEDRFCSDHALDADSSHVRAWQLRKEVGPTPLKPEMAALGLDGALPIRRRIVRTCAAPGCDNRFSGPSNKRYCSTTCGNRQRQRRHRD